MPRKQASGHVLEAISREEGGPPLNVEGSVSWAEALEKENRKRTRPELQHLLLVFLTGFVTSSLLLPLH